MKEKCPHCYLTLLPAQKKKKKEKRKKEFSPGAKPHLTQHESMLLFWSGFMESQCHEMHIMHIALLMPFLLNLLTSSPLKWVCKWEHLCYL